MRLRTTERAEFERGKVQVTVMDRTSGRSLSLTIYETTPPEVIALLRAAVTRRGELACSSPSLHGGAGKRRAPAPPASAAGGGK